MGGEGAALFYTLHTLNLSCTFYCFVQEVIYYHHLLIIVISSVGDNVSGLESSLRSFSNISFDCHPNFDY